MGLKLERLEVSRFFFFKRGCTVASLKVGGTQPDVRQEFINVRTVGPTASKTSFRRRGGMQSEGQLEGRRSLTTSVRAGRDIGAK